MPGLGRCPEDVATGGRVSVEGPAGDTQDLTISYRLVF